MHEWKKWVLCVLVWIYRNLETKKSIDNESMACKELWQGQSGWNWGATGALGGLIIVSFMRAAEAAVAQGQRKGKICIFYIGIFQ